MTKHSQGGADAAGRSTDGCGPYFPDSLKPGDIVQRNLSGVIMDLKISELTDTHIICGPWTFDRENGVEIDEELGWNRHATGSYLLPKT